MKFVFGLDIGYSGVKMAYGNPDLQPILRMMPSGCAPAEQMPLALEGNVDERIGSRVLIDGVPFVAGVSATRIQGYTRVLHEDYPLSTEYRALFYAALLQAGRDVIDVLVTGLPVSQHIKDDSAKAGLARRMEGTHYVDGKRAIEVKQVIVLPQPLGAYMDAHQAHQEIRASPEARVLIVDPGYYSMDWVCLQHRHIHDASSGTTMDAMSQVLDLAASDITAAHRDRGARVNPDLIEDAIREGRSTILLFGQPVQFAPFLHAAAQKVSAKVVNDIRNQMRKTKANLDFIVLAGGAAALYEKAFADAFPHSKRFVCANPVMSNARGFFNAARRAAAAETKKDAA